MHAIAAAREAADPESRTKGTRPGLVVYTSEQAHSSIEKGAIAVGIGQDYCRKIAVDDEFRMRPEALERAIEQDVAAGLRPCCVVATVGTTATTSVDPVPAIADLCERRKIWLHVDSAYAGSAALLPEMRWAFEGCERADSFVTNPHKWLLTPMDCSIFYTRHPQILRRAFSLIPEYLQTAQDPRAINLMDYGVPLGRRFRALKLWFVLRSFGRAGIAEMIRGHIAMAQELAKWVDADPQFERTAPSPFSVVNFRYNGTDDQNRAAIEMVNATGEAFLSGTTLRGRFTMRVAIGNVRTRPETIARVWEIVKASVGKL
jgi:aromatic-L-amino-acid decarboxylase